MLCPPQGFHPAWDCHKTIWGRFFHIVKWSTFNACIDLGVEKVCGNYLSEKSARKCLKNPENVFTISSRRDSSFAGWNARRNNAAIAVLLRGFATPQTARKATVPKGWSEIGRFLRADSCLHPGASGEPPASNSSRLRFNAAA